MPEQPRAAPAIVECSPNFSEGRRTVVIEAIADAAAAAGATVLDVQIDAEQNRSVVRFAGEPAAVERAALAAAAIAVEQIDLTQHAGTHPRIGAVDVIPFAPVAGATVADCVALAERVGAALARELDLPVYLYGEAARRPDRRDLAAIRDGEFEGLRAAIDADGARRPDFGPARLGPAGAVAVGARHLVVHGLVHLAPAGDALAAAVAAGLSGATGGLAHVEARVVDLDDGAAAVGFAVRRPDETPLPRVAAVARAEAERHGGRVAGIALRGFVPQAVLVDAAAWQLQLTGFRSDQIIENHVGRAVAAPAGPAAAGDFLAEVASDTATPGGGSVAAMVGALGAALNHMVAGLTIGKPRYAASDAEMRRVQAQAKALQAELTELIAVDSAAFDAVMAAYRLPRGTTDESAIRRDAIQAALRRATAVPLDIVRRALEVLKLTRIAVEHGNASAISDAGVAGIMALAAAQGASLNVDVNVIGLRDLEEGDRYRRDNAELIREARQVADEIDRFVRAKISGSS